MLRISEVLWNLTEILFFAGILVGIFLGFIKKNRKDQVSLHARKFKPKINMQAIALLLLSPLWVGFVSLMIGAVIGFPVYLILLSFFLFLGFSANMLDKYGILEKNAWPNEVLNVIFDFNSPLWIMPCIAIAGVSVGALYTLGMFEFLFEEKKIGK
ncbi:MAG: hypothetical protein NPIRA04_00060 [Nitrospirales bacterium]|nr:MAG: hypothetical protein NPIRA04_00060 [Nitrospirales bacterium]